jgi:hypothetical protein
MHRIFDFLSNLHIPSLKCDYQKYQIELNGTGGGIMAEQQEDDPSVVNRIGKC